MFCTSQFQITPNIGIQVTATEILFYFLSNLTLYQSFNDGGKVTHMDIFSLTEKINFQLIFNQNLKINELKTVKNYVFRFQLVPTNLKGTYELFRGFYQEKLKM